MRVFGVMILVMLFIQQISCRKFSDVELAKELKSQGMPVDQTNDWVCLVLGESNGDTEAMNTNSNGSKDWGLFQINDRWWCGKGGRNECNIECEELLSDNITVAVKCAKKIKKRQGFKAWVAWMKKCKGKTLKDYTKYL